MSVQDHGLEVLKKSGEEVTPGNKSDYYIKVKDIFSSSSGASTATVSLVSRSSTVVTLKAANTSRKFLTLYNNSSGFVYVKLGSGASSSDFSIRMSGRSYYVLPSPIYTGIVTAIWVSAGAGEMLITEGAV